MNDHSALESDPRHPIEILHNVRDELQNAVTRLHRDGRRRPGIDEFEATSSTVVATLASLWQLTDVLSGRLDQYSEREIEAWATEDHPVSDYRIALDSLEQIRDILVTAYSGADQCWSALRQLHQHTAPPDGEHATEDDGAS